MTWSSWYSIASYSRSALWIVPFFAIVTEIALSRLTEGLDQRVAMRFMDLGVAGATALYESIITLTLSFLVFTFGSLLVAIQVASGQLTPRVIATTLLRNNAVRYTVGVFVFTFLFALRGANRMGDSVNQLHAVTAGMLGLLSLIAFLFLIDYAARLLRPARIVWYVGQSGLAVLESVYPAKVADGSERPSPATLGTADRTLLHDGTSATLLAVNVKALSAIAGRKGGIIELVPHVGDFVAVDEPLFRLYGDVWDVPDTQLHGAVAFGPERTMEQDPTFAFRILVDIALKGLSKAINDPTTAVLAIDQLHRLLRTAGSRDLQHDEITDRNGRVLVFVRTPDWEDYVHLACREIRIHAGENIQIPRRMRAMLENLLGTLPRVRHEALLAELRLLDRMVEKVYTIPEDLELALAADSQGMGGATAHLPSRTAAAEARGGATIVQYAAAGSRPTIDP